MEIDIAIISVIVFIGIVSACGTVMMIIRDLAVSGNGTAGISHGLWRGRSFRRTPNSFDEEPARSFSGKLDQAFDRLILETGYDFSPMTGFLFLVAIGLLSGGILFVYYDNIAIGCVGMAVGMLLPLFVWMVRRHRRMLSMQEQLPHVIDLLARAVRAGESVDQAIELVGTESRGDLAREFMRCSQQIRMGLSLSSALRYMARRVRLLELKMMVTTLQVHRQTGGNLPVALERLANVIRDRLNYRRQMRASTGAGRTSTLLIAVISPIVYIIMFVFQPEHVSILIEDAVGRILLVIAVILELVGVFWVVQMLRHDY